MQGLCHLTVGLIGFRALQGALGFRASRHVGFWVQGLGFKVRKLALDLGLWVSGLARCEAQRKGSLARVILLSLHSLDAFGRRS